MSSTMQLLIEHGGQIQEPVTVGEVQLSWQRSGAPGKLTFTVVKTSLLDFQEGEAVRFTADGTDMFQGYVFTKSRNRDGTIRVTAYDQLRYLKNRGTFLSDEGLTAAQVVSRLAGDLGLQTGSLADTGYAIPVVDEEDQTYLDMIQNAIDETWQATGTLYVLYDAMGKLTLQSIDDMAVDTAICGQTAEDFAYTTTIDEGVYNRISLYYDDPADGARTRYVLEDTDLVNAWGVLQYTDSIGDEETDLPATAQTLLSLYGEKSRSLTVTNCFGNPALRAGSLVPVILAVGDIDISRYMMVETVLHRFSCGTHLMDLSLR